MKNKPNFFWITGVSQTGGGGAPQLGFFPTNPRFFSDRVPQRKLGLQIVASGQCIIRSVIDLI